MRMLISPDGGARLVLGLAISLLIAACQSSSGTEAIPFEEDAIPFEEEDVGTEGDIGEEVIEPPCTPYDDDENSASQDRELRWLTCTSAPVAVDHHATDLRLAETGAELVFSGGAKDSFSTIYDEIWSLSLDATGQPQSEWVEIGNLPHNMSGHTMNFHGAFVYLTGGRHSPVSMTETFFAPRNEDGTIGEFEATTPIPVAIWHHQTLVRNDHLYVVGGQSAHNVSEDGVFRAPLLSEGGIGEWESLEVLPIAVSHHALAVVGDWIYVVGGMEHSTFLDTVYGAQFKADGTLEPWQELSSLLSPLVTPSAAAVGNKIYVMGGLDDGLRFIGDVQVAIIDEAGTLQTWEPVGDALPIGRAHVHQVASFAERIFTVGGRTDEQSGATYFSTDAFHVGVVD